MIPEWLWQGVVIGITLSIVLGVTGWVRHRFRRLVQRRAIAKVVIESRRLIYAGPIDNPEWVETSPGADMVDLLNSLNDKLKWDSRDMTYSDTKSVREAIRLLHQLSDPDPRDRVFLPETRDRFDRAFKDVKFVHFER